MNIRSAFRTTLTTWNISSDTRTWLRYLVISTVFLVSLLLAITGSTRLMTFTLAGIAFVLFAILLLRYPPAGLVLFVVASMLVPLPFGLGNVGNINTSMLFVLMLFGLWVLDMIVRQRKINLVSSKTMLPLAVFVIITAIALVNGQLRYYALANPAPISAQVGGLAVFLLSAMIFVLAANLINNIVWLQRLTWVFIFLGGIYIFGRLTPQIENVIRPLFQYGADASIFWIWLVALSSSQLLLNHNLGKLWRVLLFLLLVSTFYVGGVIAYDWKSGWLPAGVALGVVLWFTSKRWQPIVILASVIGIIYVVLGNSGLFTGGEDYSILTRDAAYKIVLEIAKVNPILGLGFGNYYWYTPLFNILGYFGVQFSSHNNYIDLFAQLGIVGLLCFMWFFYELGRLGLRLRSEVEDGFPKAYVVGVLAGLAGMLFSGMLGDWILPFVYNVGVHGLRSSLIGWLFLGGLVALEQMVKQGESEFNSKTVSIEK